MPNNLNELASILGRIAQAIACGIAMLAFFYVVGGGGWLVLPPSILLGGR